MYYFYADNVGELPREGDMVFLRSKRLFADLRSARKKKYRRILVVETDALPETEGRTKIAGESLYEALGASIPKQISVAAEAVLNETPYLPPAEIVAGGGIITRLVSGKLKLLVIFRRGVWDLPKGKRDRGESIRACAIREIVEETGLKNVTIVQPLDVTVHGYPEKGRFQVKTTHWFEMLTPDDRFKPQKSEGIEQVKWMRWNKAEKMLGFKTLRKLLSRTRGLISLVENESSGTPRAD